MTQGRKVVINTCFGGFNLSDAAQAEYANRKGISVDDVMHWEISRDDADLVAVVEQFGGKMGYGTDLKVVTIPADVKWQIDEYDGIEHVAEVHRTWS